jgi:hypothetical protein
VTNTFCPKGTGHAHHMARDPISPIINLALAPVRLAGRLGGRLVREVERAAGERARRQAPPKRGRARAKRAPKPLDDVTIARKVESAIFRDRRVAKGKVNVNVAHGAVWLRGEVKTPDLINLLEARAREVQEVRSVENLLHLPKTPAPSRTDTPPAQRKTRRSPRRPGQRKVQLGELTEEAPAPAVAEPVPREVAASGEGRSPAPLGSDEATREQEDEPLVERLDEDPAPRPEDRGLRDPKGG